MIHKVKTNHFLTNPCKVILFVTLSLLSFSCSKTTNTIGNGLISEGDLIAAYYTDTVEISCHSTTIDSIVTKGMSTLLLGSMMDPVMGSTNANIFTQLHLSSTNQRFGTAPVIDSVILQLAYSGYFGDTTTMQTLHVYELADSLSSTENYYQISDVAVKPTDLANGFQFYPHPKTTGIVVGTDTITQAVVRIPLSNSFGEQLVQTDTSVYASPENFKKHLYGLKICCESVTQDGAILSFFNSTIMKARRQKTVCATTTTSPPTMCISTNISMTTPSGHRSSCNRWSMATPPWVNSNFTSSRWAGCAL